MTPTNAERGSSENLRSFGQRSTDEIQLLDYWRLLVRRRNVVLAVATAIVGIAIVLTVLATPVYRAAATLQIERRGPDILTHKDVLSIDPSWADYQDFYQTQYKILQSRAVLGAAVEQLDLPNRPEYANRRPSPIIRFRSWLMAKLTSPKANADDRRDSAATDSALSFINAGLSIAPVRNSHLVVVSFTDSHPTLSRDIANAVAKAYQGFSLDLRYRTTEQAKNFLTKQVAKIHAEIADMERELQDFSSRKEILALRDQTLDITSQALAELNAEYIKAKARLAVAEARHESVRDAAPESLPDVLRSPLINSLKQQYADLERRHTQMSERFRGDWPALKQLEEELTQAEERLGLETENIARQVRSVAKADHEQALAEVESLARRVEDQKTEVQRVNLDAAEVASLRAAIDTKRSFLNDLQNRQSQTVVSDSLEETDTSNVRIIDRAELPKFPIRPRKAFNILVGIVLGLALGSGAAFLVDHLDNTVKTVNDVETISGLPVLAQIPFFQPLTAVPDGEADRAKAVDRLTLVSHVEPQSAFAEAFKNLRTSVLLASPDHPPRHILVTSCEPGDGKSTISVNMATVLSQLGRRVLLIDADLRRPRLDRLLEVPNNSGLSTLLTGNAELQDVLQPTTVENLEIVTSGPIPPTPSELLGSPALKTMLDSLTEEGGYDHIVIDSPPVIQVTDSVLLATRTDSTIVVVRAGKTSREWLEQGISRLRQARARVTGAVLNGVQLRSGYYYRVYDQSDTGPGGRTPLSRSRRRLRRRVGSG